jgi:NAD(P)-dependent dehydrogenase (short-subunit alcohol dehydrogenase family)
MSEDLVVLITGANSGIGRATALCLAAKGAQVIGGVRELRGRNAAAARELNSAGIRAVEMDVVNDVSVENGVRKATDKTGRIDVLINCAGIMPRGITEAFTAAQFEQVLQVNLIGPFRVMKAVLPYMRKAKSGLLINVTSIGGRMATPSTGVYCASKWGLEGLAECIGYEVSKLGIDSVILEPSLYLTDLNAKGFAPADTEILDGYEALKGMETTISARFRPAVAASGVSTDPTTIAEFIDKLIRMPPGTRPVRVTFGFDTGVAGLNAASAPFQRKYLEFMGLADCERVTRVAK